MLSFVLHPLPDRPVRVFKTKWFSRTARRVGIADAELCAAVNMLRAGRADDLGGGVWKLRLDGNRRRAIILARSERFWVFAYLFDKQDRADIGPGELATLRKIARSYASMSGPQAHELIQHEGWEEICHG